MSNQVPFSEFGEGGPGSVTSEFSETTETGYRTINGELVFVGWSWRLVNGVFVPPEED